MRQLNIDPDTLSARLLELAVQGNVCILDSCGVGHLGSHLMVAGVEPVEVIAISKPDADATLQVLNDRLEQGFAAIFSISYELGRKMADRRRFMTRQFESAESDIFAALFDVLIVHDYSTNLTFLTGDHRSFDRIETLLSNGRIPDEIPVKPSTISSNFTRRQYITTVETIKELIREGETYQTNLTQQFRAVLSNGTSPEIVFHRLRRDHPAPFAAFLKRCDSTVVSASPERFFKMSKNSISASPIKGTRPRGSSKGEDDEFRYELLSSMKDRAENTMIVDLLRNDLGHVCDFGSISVERLCEIEEHPTLFHLVSTINGRLRNDVGLSEVLRALFPCGSITGAPKIRTMEILDKLEPSSRGLSMGAIGYFVPETGFEGLDTGFDLSVAIRTMVIRGREAVFNVGGGITIESDAEAEYEESMIKAKALLAALGNK